MLVFKVKAQNNAEISPVKVYVSPDTDSQNFQKSWPRLCAIKIVHASTCMCGKIQLYEKPLNGSDYQLQVKFGCEYTGQAKYQ